MQEIVSGVEVFHMVFRKKDFEGGTRQNIVKSHEFLQCAALNFPAGQTFRPHRHIHKQGPARIIAQESWVVIQGRVKATYYGDDNTIICEAVLEAGDASFTLRGGHTYEILEHGTLVYEFKNGPYTGIENDKEFID